MSAYSPASKASSPKDNGAVDNTSNTATLNNERLSAASLRSKSRAKPDRELAESWLTWQCQMVSGVIRGAVFLPDQISPNAPLACWPADGLGMAQLVAAATQAKKKNSSAQFSKIGYGPNSQRLCDVVTCPIYKDGAMVAVIAVAFSVRSDPQQHAVLQLLRWGGLWLETLLDKRQPDARQKQQIALQLVASISHQTNCDAACIETVNQLSIAFACDRVCIGIIRGLSLRLQAISQTTNFDANSVLVRRLEAALNEAIDLKSTILHPDMFGEKRGYRAHAELCEHHGSSTVLTVPLVRGEQIIGAICFEQSSTSLFDVTTARQCESITQLIAPVLELKLERERPILQQLSSFIATKLRLIFGQQYFKFKLFVASTLFALFAAANLEVAHNVSAPANIKGSVQQLIVAPHNGYVLSASARAGDNVSEGQILANLEDRQLRLEVDRFKSQKKQIEQKYRDALSRQDRTEMGKLKAQLNQSNADIALAQQAMERTALRSPYDGVVISGDLSQALGTPIKTGQVLFEIAPLDDYRVVLEVPEQEVGQLRVGQQGLLLITAFPEQPFMINVEQIVPLASSNELGNYFQVEATLEQPNEQLRPGMSGHGKIHVGKNSLLWVWTHRLIDNLKLLSWSVGL